MITVDRADELAAHVGAELGVSGWISLSEADIATFAAVTGDEHWLHTDPPRAARDAPFGGVIAHGFLALSLVTALSKQCYEVRSAVRWLNYGLDRIRFTAPLRPGQAVRLRLSLTDVQTDIQAAPEATRLTLHCVLETEASTVPVLVAEWIVLVFEPEPEHETRDLR